MEVRFKTMHNVIGLLIQDTAVRKAGSNSNSRIQHGFISHPDTEDGPISIGPATLCDEMGRFPAILRF